MVSDEISQWSERPSNLLSRSRFTGIVVLTITCCLLLAAGGLLLFRLVPLERSLAAVLFVILTWTLVNINVCYIPGQDRLWLQLVPTAMMSLAAGCLARSIEPLLGLDMLYVLVVVAVASMLYGLCCWTVPDLLDDWFGAAVIAFIWLAFAEAAILQLADMHRDHWPSFDDLAAAVLTLWMAIVCRQSYQHPRLRFVAIEDGAAIFTVLFYGPWVLWNSVRRLWRLRSSRK